MTYTKQELEEMMTENGGSLDLSGRRYNATYVSEYGGVMFFCIPYDEVIVGYEPKG